ncbi:hypothetical protein [Actinomadura litoris]|uniref:hypothetical protein n=1 Tax=Actinomadura litoris TaxID=2678616 RepID=UPI001FA7159D|nr:hypothetical protein [Actinomadura litoris]
MLVKSGYVLAREHRDRTVPEAGREAGLPDDHGGRQATMLKRSTPVGHGRYPSASASSSLMMPKGVSWV